MCRLVCWHQCSKSRTFSFILSTCFAVFHLADLFPGGGNQHGGDYANLKIQWICDLKNSAVEQVSLSGFTRNDQAAAPDILNVARPGDLVLRDLGYLVTSIWDCANSTAASPLCSNSPCSPNCSFARWFAGYATCSNSSAPTATTSACCAWDASSDSALVGSPPLCWASPSPSG